MENEANRLLGQASDESEEPKRPVVLGRWYTRTLAALADFFLTLVIAVFLFDVPLTYAFHFYDNLATYSSAETQIIAASEASKLVKKGNDGNFVSQSALCSDYILSKDKKETFDDDGHYVDVLAAYYIEYKGESVATFNTKVLGLPSEVTTASQSPLWAYPEGVASADDKIGVLNDEVYSKLDAYLHGSLVDASGYNSLKDFFNGSYATAYEEFSNEPAFLSLYETYTKTYYKMRWNAAFSAEIAFYASALVFYFVLPFFLKGSTLGKLILKLKVGDDKGNPPSKQKIVLRQFLEIVTLSFGFTIVPFFSTWAASTMNLPFFAIGSSEMTFGITMVIFFFVALASLITMMVREDKKAFHDLAVGTSVYSTDIKLIAEAERLARARSPEEEESKL